MRHFWWIGMLLLAGCTSRQIMPERSIAQLSDDMAAGRTSSERLVKAYLG